ncbi:MAG: APC family permease [Bryobacteraceae bacterium]
MSEPRQTLRLRDLVLFNIAAVVGIRWLAAAAHIGPGSVALWISAAALFFVPCALVVARLNEADPVEGGIYHWTKQAFGEWHGFLCGTSYWVNNLFYFPALVVAGVSMGAYVFGRQGWSHERAFVVPVSLAILAAITEANRRGLGTGKWIGVVGGAATYLTGVVLIICGVWAWYARGGANRMDLIPRLDWERLNFWPQIAFAFGGLELGSILSGEIEDAARTVRTAAWMSGAAIALFYVGGTVAMLGLLPAAEIDVVTGLTQAAASVPLPGLTVGLGALVTVGVIGQVGAWMTGTSRLPVVLGMDRFLPLSFAELRRALLIQGLVCGALLVIMQLGDTFQTGYQVLVDFTVITYFIPFVYLFLAGWRQGLRLPAACGLFVTLVAIAFSLVPPAGTESALLFETKLAGGSLALIAGARWWFRRCTA